MRRILIVDDEQDICECLRDFFSSRGFSVTMAYSGEEALERLSEGDVDVIVLDIVLPGISGLEVLRRAKQLRPSTKIVMLTGLSHCELRDYAHDCGARGYVTKPFDFSEQTWASVFSCEAVSRTAFP